MIQKVKNTSKDENEIFDDILINNKNYFLIEFMNKLEVGGILKATNNFDIIKGMGMETELLYYKQNNNIINYLENINVNDNNKKEFVIKKGNIIILDIKSTYQGDGLVKQMLEHDKLLYNLYNTCRENLNQIIYVGIITDKGYNYKKYESFQKELNIAKFNLKNILIFKAKESKICGNNYEAVINQEYLTKILLNKISDSEQNLNNKIDNVKDELNTKIDNVKDELNTKIDNVKDELNTKIDELNTKIDNVKDELKAVNEKLDKFSTKFDDFLERSNRSYWSSFFSWFYSDSKK